MLLYFWVYTIHALKFFRFYLFKLFGHFLAMSAFWIEQWSWLIRAGGFSLHLAEDSIAVYLAFILAFHFIFENGFLQIRQILRLLILLGALDLIDNPLILLLLGHVLFPERLNLIVQLLPLQSLFSSSSIMSSTWSSSRRPSTKLLLLLILAFTILLQRLSLLQLYLIFIISFANVVVLGIDFLNLSRVDCV